MKVYELMSILEKLPCNMVISIQGEANNGDPFPISRVECDDATPGSSVWFLFDDSGLTYDEDQEEGQKDKAVVLNLPKKRGRPPKAKA